MLKLKKWDHAASLDLLYEYWRNKKTELNVWKDEVPSVLQSQHNTAKAQWLSRDKNGRPCIVIKPGKHLYQKHNPTLLFAMILFEQACDLIMETEGINDFCVLIDFEGFATRNFDMIFVKNFIMWARKFYKNLLGTCYAIKCPGYALLCWNVVKLLIPAATVEKMIIFKKDEWRKTILENFSVSSLPIEYGGNTTSAKLCRKFR